jgi:hypothetical protein
MKNWILMQTIKRALGSRKFIYTVVGVIVQLLSDNWGIDAATSQNILYGIIALVLGQGWADASKK